MSDVDTLFADPKTGDMRPAVWRNPRSGKMHLAEGGTFDFYQNNFRLMWTRCGKSDIPANAAWLQNADDEVACAECCRAAGLIPPTSEVK